MDSAKDPDIYYNIPEQGLVLLFFFLNFVFNFYKKVQLRGEFRIHSNPSKMELFCQNKKWLFTRMLHLRCLSVSGFGVFTFDFAHIMYHTNDFVTVTLIARGALVLKSDNLEVP